MVEEVMDARRPNTQENGRDMVTAPVPILPTCKKVKNITENTIAPFLGRRRLTKLTRSCSRKQK